MRIRKRESAKKLWRDVFWILVLAVIASFLLSSVSGFFSGEQDDKRNKKTYNFISPISRESAKSGKVVSNIFRSLRSVFRMSLSDRVNRELKGVTGTYGVVVEDLHGGERFTLNENETFYMASLYKMMVMYAAYKKVAEGSLSLSEKVGNSTWGDAIGSMITVSDNLAGESLGTRLGWGEIQQLMRSFGMNRTTLTGDLSSTPSDIASFLERLARGQAISEDFSRRMIEVLLRQRLNSRLPKYLPAEVKVAHKTGEFSQFRHDAGIVFLPDGRSYIIVVMSKDSGLDQESSEVVARISKAVYGYFKE